MPRHLPGYIFFGLAYAFIAFVALFAWPGTGYVTSRNVEAGTTLAAPKQVQTVAGAPAEHGRR